MIIISGPCVIESRDIVLEIADKLAYLHEDSDIEFYYKASFDKANRTSLDSFRGPGLDEGLKILQEVKDNYGYKILTDIHDVSQAHSVSQVADVLQIPAFLSRQTDLLVSAGKTKSIVNIKKGQFLSPEQMQYSTAKVLKTRGINENNYQISKKNGVWLTERGSTFGYGNLVVDMRSLSIMREFAPVIFDATHSVQMPGANHGKSGGNSSFVPLLSRSAAAAGVDGFFFETHPNPNIALSDGPNMITPDKLKQVIKDIKNIQEVI